MKKPNASKSLVMVLIATLLLAPAAMAAPQDPNRIVEIENFGNGLVFYPIVEARQMVLTVTGPCGYEYREVSEGGEMLFKLDETTIDGMYTFNVTRMEKIDSSVLNQLKNARKTFDEEVPKKLCRQGRLPAAPISQSAGFLVQDAKVMWDEFSVDEAFTEDITKRFDDPYYLANKVGTTGAGEGVPTKDFVINDDLIVDGSACIGFDCVNGESFSFDTIRLKENNLRIKFDDTSVAASFPRTDWQLTANASANGGASKFSIDDISGSRTPFTVEANARSHSLYVDDGGRIGNRTSTPSTEIHSIDGDTPTLRLQQDGSSGFGPQTWDVAGNETNFFIRDVPSGSNLPFRIRPGAPSNSIYIDTPGDIGMGTASPDGALHVLRNDGTAKALVQEATSDAGIYTLLELATTGGAGIDLRPRFTISHGGVNANWNFDILNNGNFAFIRNQGSVFTFTSGGDLQIEGDFVSNGNTLNVPDYVFADDYHLMPLEEVQTFIETESHLPHVPSAAEITSGTFNLTEMQLTLLRKVEELTLYTLDQHDTIRQHQETIADHQQLIRDQQELIQRMAQRLDSLESSN